MRRESAYGHRKPTMSFRCCPYCKQIMLVQATKCTTCGQESSLKKSEPKPREWRWLG